jgi:hypothetical protein
MRKIITFAAVTALAGSVFAANIDQDTKEIGIVGGVDFDTAFGTEIDLTLKGGYFWIDYLEFGGLIGLFDNDAVKAYELGAFAEYNFVLETPVIPYIGAALSYGSTEVQIGDTAPKLDESAAIGSFNVGIKYFITDDVALDTDFIFRIASSDVFPEDNEVTDTDIQWRIGLRFFWE